MTRAAPSSVVSRIAHTFDPAPKSDETEPWWHRVGAELERAPERFSLEADDLWYVRTTAAIDLAVRTMAGAAFGALALPIASHPRKIRETLEDRELYQAIADRGDPHEFFVAPAHGIPVRVRPARSRHFKPTDGECVDVSFESPFVPINPRMRDAFRKHRSNRIARARYYRHHGKPRPTIVAIHGFLIDQYVVNETLFALPRFYEQGYDVVLFTLPFHGQRQGTFSPFSGHGMIANGVSATNEAFAQGICDLRVLVDWLTTSQRVPRVGVTGVSMGGYVSALLAAVEPRLAFVIPNTPMTSLPDTVLQWEPMASAVRALLSAVGASVRDFRRMFAVHCPLNYTPVVPRDRRMIVGGVGDRLAPPAQARLLWEHWDRCRIHWFPGSHILHVKRSEYLDQMLRFLEDINFGSG